MGAGTETLDSPSQAEYANYVPHAGSVENVKPRYAIARPHYAEDVTAVKVRVKRILHRIRSERIVLSGLRLVPRSGHFALLWTGTRIPNSLGIDVRVDPHDRGYTDGSYFQSRPSNGDEQTIPALGLSLPDVRRTASTNDPWVNDETTMTIEGKDLDRLNVLGLVIGRADWRAKGRVSGPVRTKPLASS